MGLNEFILGLANLEKIQRRRGSLSLQNIASRRILFESQMIAQTLADIEEQAGNTIDWQILYEKSIKS